MALSSSSSSASSSSLATRGRSPRLSKLFRFIGDSYRQLRKRVSGLKEIDDSSEIFIECINNYKNGCYQIYEEVLESCELCGILSNNIARTLDIFKDIYSKYAYSDEYHHRMCELMSIFIVLELRISVDFEHDLIANRIIYNMKRFLTIPGDEEATQYNILLTLMYIPRLFNARRIMCIIMQEFISVSRPPTEVQQLPDKLYMLYIIIFYRWMMLEDNSEHIVNYAAMFMKPCVSLCNNNLYVKHLPPYTTHSTATRTILKNLKFYRDIRNASIIDNGYKKSGDTVDLCDDDDIIVVDESQDNLSFVELFTAVQLETSKFKSTIKHESTAIIDSVDLTVDDDNNDSQDAIIRNHDKWLYKLHILTKQFRQCQKRLQQQKMNHPKRKFINLDSDDSSSTEEELPRILEVQVSSMKEKKTDRDRIRKSRGATSNQPEDLFADNYPITVTPIDSIDGQLALSDVGDEDDVTKLPRRLLSSPLRTYESRKSFSGNGPTQQGRLGSVTARGSEHEMNLQSAARNQKHVRFINSPMGPTPCCSKPTVCTSLLQMAHKPVAETSIYHKTCNFPQFGSFDNVPSTSTGKRQQEHIAAAASLFRNIIDHSSASRNIFSSCGNSKGFPAAVDQFPSSSTLPSRSLLSPSDLSDLHHKRHKKINSLMQRRATLSCRSDFDDYMAALAMSNKTASCEDVSNYPRTVPGSKSEYDISNRYQFQDEKLMQNCSVLIEPSEELLRYEEHQRAVLYNELLQKQRRKLELRCIEKRKEKERKRQEKQQKREQYLREQRETMQQLQRMQIRSPSEEIQRMGISPDTQNAGNNSESQHREGNEKHSRCELTASDNKEADSSLGTTSLSPQAKQGRCDIVVQLERQQFSVSDVHKIKKPELMNVLPTCSEDEHTHKSPTKCNLVINKTTPKDHQTAGLLSHTFELESSDTDLLPLRDKIKQTRSAGDTSPAKRPIRARRQSVTAVQNYSEKFLASTKTVMRRRTSVNTSKPTQQMRAECNDSEKEALSPIRSRGGRKPKMQQHTDSELESDQCQKLHQQIRRQSPRLKQQKEMEQTTDSDIDKTAAMVVPARASRGRAKRTKCTRRSSLKSSSEQKSSIALETTKESGSDSAATKSEYNDNVSRLQELTIVADIAERLSSPETTIVQKKPLESAEQEDILETIEDLLQKETKQGNQLKQLAYAEDSAVTSRDSIVNEEVSPKVPPDLQVIENIVISEIQREMDTNSHHGHDENANAAAYTSARETLCNVRNMENKLLSISANTTEHLVESLTDVPSLTNETAVETSTMSSFNISNVQSFNNPFEGMGSSHHAPSEPRQNAILVTENILLANGNVDAAKALEGSQIIQPVPVDDMTASLLTDVETSIIQADISDISPTSITIVMPNEEEEVEEPGQPGQANANGHSNKQLLCNDLDGTQNENSKGMMMNVSMDSVNIAGFVLETPFTATAQSSHESETASSGCGSLRVSSDDDGDKQSTSTDVTIQSANRQRDIFNVNETVILNPMFSGEEPRSDNINLEAANITSILEDSDSLQRGTRASVESPGPRYCQVKLKRLKINRSIEITAEDIATERNTQDTTSFGLVEENCGEIKVVNNTITVGPSFSSDNSLEGHVVINESTANTTAHLSDNLLEVIGNNESSGNTTAGPSFSSDYSSEALGNNETSVPASTLDKYESLLIERCPPAAPTKGHQTLNISTILKTSSATPSISKKKSVTFNTMAEIITFSPEDRHDDVGCLYERADTPPPQDFYRDHDYEIRGANATDKPKRFITPATKKQFNDDFNISTSAEGYYDSSSSHETDYEEDDEDGEEDGDCEDDKEATEIMLASARGNMELKRVVLVPPPENFRSAELNETYNRRLSPPSPAYAFDSTENLQAFPIHITNEEAANILSNDNLQCNDVAGNVIVSTTYRTNSVTTSCSSQLTILQNAMMSPSEHEVTSTQETGCRINTHKDETMTTATTTTSGICERETRSLTRSLDPISTQTAAAAAGLLQNNQVDTTDHSSEMCSPANSNDSMSSRGSLSSAALMEDKRHVLSAHEDESTDSDNRRQMVKHGQRFKRTQRDNGEYGSISPSTTGNWYDQLAYKTLSSESKAPELKKNLKYNTTKLKHRNPFIVRSEVNKEKEATDKNSLQEKANDKKSQTVQQVGEESYTTRETNSEEIENISQKQKDANDACTRDSNEIYLANSEETENILQKDKDTNDACKADTKWNGEKQIDNDKYNNKTEKTTNTVEEIHKEGMNVIPKLVQKPVKSKDLETHSSKSLTPKTKATQDVEESSNNIATLNHLPNNLQQPTTVTETPESGGHENNKALTEAEILNSSHNKSSSSTQKSTDTQPLNINSDSWNAAAPYHAFEASPSSMIRKCPRAYNKSSCSLSLNNKSLVVVKHSPEILRTYQYRGLPDAQKDTTNAVADTNVKDASAQKKFRLKRSKPTYLSDATPLSLQANGATKRRLSISEHNENPDVKKIKRNLNVIDFQDFEVETKMVKQTANASKSEETGQQTVNSNVSEEGLHMVIEEDIKTMWEEITKDTAESNKALTRNGKIEKKQNEDKGKSYNPGDKMVAGRKEDKPNNTQEDRKSEANKDITQNDRRNKAKKQDQVNNTKYHTKNKDNKPEPKRKDEKTLKKAQEIVKETAGVTKMEDKQAQHHVNNNTTERFDKYHNIKNKSSVVMSFEPQDKGSKDDEDKEKGHYSDKVTSERLDRDHNIKNKSSARVMSFEAEDSGSKDKQEMKLNEKDAIKMSKEKEKQQHKEVKRSRRTKEKGTTKDPGSKDKQSKEPPNEGNPEKSTDNKTIEKSNETTKHKDKSQSLKDMSKTKTMQNDKSNKNLKENQTNIKMHSQHPGNNKESNIAPTANNKTETKIPNLNEQLKEKQANTEQPSQDNGIIKESNQATTRKEDNWQKHNEAANEIVKQKQKVTDSMPKKSAKRYPPQIVAVKLVPQTTDAIERMEMEKLNSNICELLAKEKNSNRKSNICELIAKEKNDNRKSNISEFIAKEKNDNSKSNISVFIEKEKNQQIKSNISPIIGVKLVKEHDVMLDQKKPLNKESSNAFKSKHSSRLNDEASTKAKRAIKTTKQKSDTETIIKTSSITGEKDTCGQLNIRKRSPPTRRNNNGEYLSINSEDTALTSTAANSLTKSDSQSSLSSLRAVKKSHTSRHKTSKANSNSGETIKDGLLPTKKHESITQMESNHSTEDNKSVLKATSIATITATSSASSSALATSTAQPRKKQKIV